MKIYLLSTLIGISFITLGCGQKGDLIRPVPQVDKSIQAPEKQDKKHKY